MGFLRTLLTLRKGKGCSDTLLLQNKNGTGRRLRQDRAKWGPGTRPYDQLWRPAYSKLREG